MDEDHRRYEKAVFKWLAKSKFYMKYKKCAFFLQEVEFLGHAVSEHRVLELPVWVLLLKGGGTPTSINLIYWINCNL